MLHVFTLNVLIFNLVILKVVLHELIQLVEGLPLLVVGLSPLLHLVVVRVNTRVVFIIHLERVLGFLSLFVPSPRRKIVLRIVIRDVVVIVFPAGITDLLIFLLELL